MKKLFIAALLLSTLTPSIGFSKTTIYYVQYVYKETTIFIEDEKFSALSCFGFIKGDPVVFLDNKNPRFCTRARLGNLRTRTICDIWCDAN